MLNKPNAPITTNGCIVDPPKVTQYKFPTLARGRCDWTSSAPSVVCKAPSLRCDSYTATTSELSTPVKAVYTVNIANLYRGKSALDKYQQTALTVAELIKRMEVYLQLSFCKLKRKLGKGVLMRSTNKASNPNSPVSDAHPLGSKSFFRNVSMTKRSLCPCNHTMCSAIISSPTTPLDVQVLLLDNVEYIELKKAEVCLMRRCNALSSLGVFR